MIDPEALSPEKRAQILRGAAAVFLHDGYEGASMSRIAQQANVSKGTLYNHFENKADLFRAYLVQACSQVFAHVFDGLDNIEDLEEALTGIGRRMMEVLMTPERRALYRMAISEAEAFPDVARAFYKAGPRLSMEALAGWLSEQVAKGRLAADDTRLAAEQFFALCQTRLPLPYRLHLQDQPAEEEIGLVVREAVKTFLARYRPA